MLIGLMPLTNPASIAVSSYAVHPVHHGRTGCGTVSYVDTNLFVQKGILFGGVFLAVLCCSAGEEGGGCTSSWLDGGDSYGGEDDIVESQCPGGVSGRFSGQDHHGPWSAEGTSMLYSFIAQCM